MQEKLIKCEKSGIRLDVCISEKLEQYSRGFINSLIKDEKVLVNGKTTKPGLKLVINDEIRVYIPEPKMLEITAEKLDFKVVFEDEDIIVVDKPRGMVVHPAIGNYTGTLVNGLLDYCKGSLSDINGVIRPGIVHRIDKDTSGLIVIAKNNVAHEFLSELFKNHTIERKYIALVEGEIKEKNGKITAPVGRHPVDRKKMSVNSKNGRRAVTYFKVIERYKNATMIEVKLETGRTHQIRVHMSYIGYPVMCDEVYGRKSRLIKNQGQMLHAKLLGFKHPRTGQEMIFESDLPEYYLDAIEILKK